MKDLSHDRRLILTDLARSNAGRKTHEIARGIAVAMAPLRGGQSPSLAEFGIRALFNPIHQLLA